MTLRDLIRAHAGLLLAGLATFILMGAGQSLYGPALPAFSRAFGISTGEAGLLVSAHWVGCLIGVLGMFVAGPRATPRHTLGLMALGMGGVAALAGWSATIAAAVVFGIGYGCATVVFNPRILQAFGAQGTAMLSLLNATFGLGAIAAPLVFVWLGNDPRATFGLVAVLCAVVCLMARTSGNRAEHAATAPVPFRLHPGILCFGAMAIGMEACLIGLGPTALIRAGLTEVRAAELLSAFFAAFLASRVVLIFCAHLVRSFTLYLVGVTGTAICALGAALLSPGPFFVAIGFCAGLFFPAFFVTASRRMGTDARVPPTIVLAGLVGGIASPLLLAPLLDGMGARGFFWMLMAVSAALAVAAGAMLRTLNR